ncbi:MAG: hypothetical protein ACFE9Q_16465 [Candidatus Hodarchaeota archaeon]
MGFNFQLQISTIFLNILIRYGNVIFEELIGLLKKKGFKDTLHVLINQKDYQTDKHTFYNELNKFSYYNSFFRVKDELVKKGLIEITNTHKVKSIKLTKKGLDVYEKLNEINNMVKK